MTKETRRVGCKNAAALRLLQPPLASMSRPTRSAACLLLACEAYRSARHSEVTALNGAAREVWMERAGDR